MKLVIGLFLLASVNAYAVESMSPAPAVPYLEYYQYLQMLNAGESCQFTAECDSGENCMESQICAPMQCDDSHKCVVGETCDSGFCHI